MHDIDTTRLILLAVSWTGISACASLPGKGSDHAAPRLRGSETATRSRARIITAVDLASVDTRSTIDAIRILRPEFLRPQTARRPHVDGELPAVYVDDLYGGGLEALSTVPVRAVLDIHFLTPGEASIRYGFKHVGAVILVRTSTGR